jgi:hypothetical protein
VLVAAVVVAVAAAIVFVFLPARAPHPHPHENVDTPLRGIASLTFPEAEAVLEEDSAEA